MYFSIAKRVLCAVLLLLTCNFSASQNPSLALLYPVPESSLSPSYLRLVANRSASFHPNFSAGRAGQIANGNLVSPSIEDNANGVTFLGRANFVQSLVGGPAGTQFLDQLIIQEGNAFGILFVQREQANGVRIEIGLGETMVFDENALLNKLITIGQGSLATLQATGQIPVPPFQPINVTRIPDGISTGFTAQIKAITAQLNRNFNAANSSSNSAFAAPNVTVHANGRTTNGSAAFLDLFTRYNTSLPSLLAHDEYIIAQGNYAAVEFLWSGVRNGTFTALNGTQVPPDCTLQTTRGMRFLRFDVSSGLIQEVWEIADNDAFLAPGLNLTGGCAASVSATSTAANPTQTDGGTPIFRRGANMPAAAIVAAAAGWFAS